MLKRNDNAPFDVLSWLEGRTAGQGVFEDRKGRIRRRFSVETVGHASGNSLILDEHFLFDDGENQQRRWTLMRGAGGAFTGRCEDGVGEARGSFQDGVAYLSSELRLKAGGRLIAMRFEDAFYPVGSDAVFNRSSVTKWGIRLGQVLIAFRKA